MTSKRKKVVISVISDLVTDQRVQKTAQVLHNLGYEVLVLGRKLKNSPELPVLDFKTKRVKLPFERGVLFYASYNIWNFFFLLFTKADVLHSNDLDTLLSNYLASKLKGVPLVYDSHEYFTGVPEIQKKKIVKWVWENIENWIFPKLDFVYTVNESIATIYRNKYKVDVKVVRNAPFLDESVSKYSDRSRKQPVFTILYQGAVNVDRGLEETIEAMVHVEDIILWIVGAGDVLDNLKNLSNRLDVNHKVKFWGRMSPVELKKLTPLADLGLSLEKPNNPNYELCLPNKLFDYIHAGIPILASRVKEVELVIDQYNIGTFISNHSPLTIANKLNQIKQDPEQLRIWQLNTLKAKREFNWQEESKTIGTIYSKIFSAK